MVEGARLESVFTGDRNEGSNPSLTATHLSNLSLAARPRHKPPTLRVYCPSNPSQGADNPAGYLDADPELAARSPRGRDQGEFPCFCHATGIAETFSGVLNCRDRSDGPKYDVSTAC